MKIRLALLAVALCGAFAGFSASGQTTHIWGGPGPLVDRGSNYVDNVLAALGDTLQFDTAQVTNTLLYNNPGNWQGFAGSSGITFYVDSNQTAKVYITTTQSGIGPTFALANVAIDSGAGVFEFGDTNSATTFAFITRPSGGTHTFVNNSTNTAIIDPWIKITAGGGNAVNYAFSGTGNWQVNNYLINDNSGAGPNVMEADGPGVVYWNPQGYLGQVGIGNPTIGAAGTLVLQAPYPSTKMLNQAWTLGGRFVCDIGTGNSQTLAGVISGAGSITAASGTLTLSGANTFAGGIILTNTGTVIANRAENPTAGTSGPLGEFGFIEFRGGTLQWSSLNTYDYSQRFDQTDGSMFNFDTGGQTVTLASDLFGTGSTLSETGPGTLILTGGADYTGLTTVHSGKLVFDYAKTGSGNITVEDGGTLGVYSDWQTTPAALSLGTSSGCSVEFNDVSSTSTPIIAAGAISSAGTVTINVNSGNFTTIGAHYPLISWTSGNPPAVSLGSLSGANGILVTNGNTIQLNITATAFVWTGLGGSVWDTTSDGNWKQSGNDAIFANGAPALFDDTGSTTTVTVNGVVQPTSTTVNSSALAYIIVSSANKDIAGNGGLTKNGNSILTMQGGANTYTGVTTINAGTLSVSTLSNGGLASDIGAAGSGSTNLVLGGGTLQYIGSGASIDRSFTVTSSGGTIDASGSGSLSLANPGPLNVPGSGIHNLILTGGDTNGETLAASLADGTGGALGVTKNGGNTWTLTGTNSYTGATTINAGILQVGAGGASGTLGSGTSVDNSTLLFNRTGTLTVSGPVNGTGRLVQGGAGTVVLNGANAYAGGTTISNGATLQIGSGSTGASLNNGGSIVDNGLFIYNSKTLTALNGFNVTISGTGNLIVGANCAFNSVNANTYSGWTLINSGATFVPCQGNTGSLNTSVVTNNGTLHFERQDTAVFVYSNNIVGSGKVETDNNNQNPGDVTLAGANNTFTGGTWIKGGGVVVGGYTYITITTNITDVSTNYTTNTFFVDGGSLVGPVIFTNTSSSWQNSRQLTFNFGTDRVIGYNLVGAVTDGSSTGNSGNVMKENTNTVVLTGNNTYPGGTTISNGVLQIGNRGSTGSAGSGAINILQPGVNLAFARADVVTFPNQITGAGGLMQIGPGTLILPGTNYTYAGVTTVSNGILVLSGEFQPGFVQTTNDVNVLGGTLVAGGYGSVDTLNVGRQLNISNGIVYVSVNKTMPQQSTYYNVSQGLIEASNATLEVINYGPALQAGDTFTVFNQLVLSDALFKFISPGVAFTDNQDGTITVASVATGKPTVTATFAGGQLNMSWPSVWTGLHVQVQTNTLAKGLGTNWFTIPGTDLNNSYSATLGKQTNSSVFYRLAQ